MGLNRYVYVFSLMIILWCGSISAALQMTRFDLTPILPNMDDDTGPVSQEISVLDLIQIQLNVAVDLMVTSNAEGELDIITVRPPVDTSIPDRIAIVGEVLNYPNPFRISEGTQIGYRLNRSAHITFQLYSMTGYLLYEKDYSSAEEGGRYKYNRISFTPNDYAVDFAPGVYVYLILTDDRRILGKGKMVLLP